jgi:hypothetical protein
MHEIAVYDTYSTNGMPDRQQKRAEMCISVYDKQAVRIS